MKHNQKKVNAGDLKPDQTVIAIRPISGYVVNNYRQAMRQGAIFPLLHITSDNRIVSGCHRHAAYLEEFGAEYPVPCLQVIFSNEADKIEHAIAENSTHGLRLDSISKKRAIFKLTALGRTPAELSKLLGMPVRRVEEIGGERVIVLGVPMPIKRGLEHRIGMEVTPEEYKTHIKSDLGVPAWREAEQLTRWLDNGWINWSDARTVLAIEKLMAALERNRQIAAA